MNGEETIGCQSIISVKVNINKFFKKVRIPAILSVNAPVPL